ncbi:MAG: PKD domain-containing protein [Bacteroidota bacterium]
MNNSSYLISSFAKIAAVFFALLLINACGEFELPESNSQIDLELPTADFTFTQDVVDFRVYQFQSLATESTKFNWDFGTGDTSTEENPIYTFEAGEGTYTVTLSTSDDNGEMASITQEVQVVEPEVPNAIIPPILEGSFEDGMLDGGSGDGRDSWRNSSLGGVIQITSSPVFHGDQASKYPSEGDRIAYQELTVSPNSDYKFTFYYTLKTDSPGSITFDVLAGGGHTDASAAEVIGSFTGSDQTDANTYVEANLEFNTGANDVISIYIHNEGEEARLDLISIEAL